MSRTSDHITLLDDKDVDFVEDQFTTQTSSPPPLPSFRPPTSEIPAVGKIEAHLIVLVGGDVGRTYAINGDVLIGRATEAMVRGTPTDISRRHALISADKGSYVIEDLGSRNGTLVNGIPVQKQALRFGDKIRVGGEMLLLFSQYDAMEDRLLQAQRLESIGQLASGVAHDFNNILGAALANISFIRGLSGDTRLDTTDVHESLEDIDAALHRAADLARQLLGLTRKDLRSDTLTDVNAVLEEVGKLVRRTFSRSISIEVKIDRKLSVVGDPGQLHQMLMNLCLNARDAMPSGGTLALAGNEVQVDSVLSQTLHEIPPGRYVVISVSDTGTGIPETVRDRIFEPFFTTKDVGSGSGLGLSTVYKIIKGHGGHLELQSTTGKGSSFSIYLPAHDGPELEYGPGAILTPRASGTRQLKAGVILLVDDDDAFRRGVERLLEGMGYAVQGVANGHEAVKAFRSAPKLFQLVLLDLDMPGMDGFQTFDQLKQSDPSVKILISSGQTPERAQPLLDAGARGFLQKPYDVGELGRALSRVLPGQD